MKIPVGKTIAYAYGFTFGNFLTVLGLSWVPLAIMAVAAYFAMPAYFQGLLAMMATQDPSQLVASAGYMFLFTVLAFAGSIMIYVGVARQALGLRTGPAFFYFSLDAAFWKLLIAYFVTFLLIMAAMFGFAILAGIIGAGAALLGAGGVALLALSPVIVIVAALYFLLRLMFFQAPVAVAEGEHVVRRSWSLAKGNVWRIFVVFLGILVPMFILQIVVEIAVFASLSIAMPNPDASPAEAAAAMSQMVGQLIALMPILAPLGIVFYAAFIGLIISASAFAYRSLVPAAEGTAAEFA